MTFAAALYTHLTADATLASYCETRIYPVAAIDPRESDHATFPNCLVFQQISREPDGNIPQASNLRIERWSVMAVSAAYDTAHTIADAVEASLNYFKGTMGATGSPLTGGVRVKSISLEDQADEADFETATYAVSMVFRVAYQPS